jgi:hypothetical protein
MNRTQKIPGVSLLCIVLIATILSTSLMAQSTVDSSERERRSAVFDDQTNNRPKLDAPQRTDGGYSEFWDRAALAAFPVDTSDEVDLGSVSNAQAFLSNDHTSIYTEFSISPERVLKGDSSTEYTILARGGSLFGPSGKILSYRGGSHNTEILTVGARYVLFLQKVPGTQGYRAIKVWLLVNGHPKAVEPEDIKAAKSGIDKTSAMTEEAFVAAVQAASH